MESTRETPRTWRRAWHDALYAEGGFYTAGPGAVRDLGFACHAGNGTITAAAKTAPTSGPGKHFRTSVNVGPALAEVMARMLADTDMRIGHPDPFDVIDIGAGDGSLIQNLSIALQRDFPHVAARTRFTGVDVHVRPPALANNVTWIRGLAPDALELHTPDPINGVVLAHEWLDNIPCEVIEIGREGQPCVVLVDDDGKEALGPSLWDTTSCSLIDVDAPAVIKWLERWWPSAVPGTFLEASLYDSEPGTRAEIGITRDDALVSVAKLINTGTLIAVDYAHDLGRRTSGAWFYGSLSGFSEGRMVDPVPNGSCDLTAHVALDACGAAVLEMLTQQGKRAEAQISSQKDILESYGMRTELPDASLASNPAAYARSLQQHSDTAELLNPVTLGHFQWLRVDIS